MHSTKPAVSPLMHLTLALKPLGRGGEQQFSLHAVRSSAACDARLLVASLHPVGEPAQAAVAVQRVRTNRPEFKQMLILDRCIRRHVSEQNLSVYNAQCTCSPLNIKIYFIMIIIYQLNRQVVYYCVRCEVLLVRRSLFGIYLLVSYLKSLF